MSTDRERAEKIVAESAHQPYPLTWMEDEIEQALTDARADQREQDARVVKAAETFVDHVDDDPSHLVYDHGTPTDAAVDELWAAVAAFRRTT